MPSERSLTGSQGSARKKEILLLERSKYKNWIVSMQNDIRLRERDDDSHVWNSDGFKMSSSSRSHALFNDLEIPLEIIHPLALVQLKYEWAPFV